MDYDNGKARERLSGLSWDGALSAYVGLGCSPVSQTHSLKGIERSCGYVDNSAIICCMVGSSFFMVLLLW